MWVRYNEFGGIAKQVSDATMRPYLPSNGKNGIQDDDGWSVIPRTFGEVEAYKNGQYIGIYKWVPSD